MIPPTEADQLAAQAILHSIATAIYGDKSGGGGDRHLTERLKPWQHMIATMLAQSRFEGYVLAKMETAHNPNS